MAEILRCALYPRGHTHQGAAANRYTPGIAAPLDSGALSLAEKIAAWLLDNMRESSGFFLLSAQAFLHCANALHALVSGWTTYALAR